MPFWRRKSMTDTVKAYVQALNSRDLKVVHAKLADDMKLVDTSGDEVSGKAQCLEVISRLLEQAPDYTLTIETYSTAGEWVLMRGFTTSSVPRFNSTMQCRARADARFVYEWQSYSDRPVRNLDHLLASDDTQKPAQDIRRPAA